MNIRTAMTMAAIWAVVAFAAGSAALGGQVRIKDITDVDGVRVNRLVGFGLITGLNGSGGNSPITRQFAINMLDKFGVTSDPIVRQTLRQNAQTPTNNISVVTVTAELPVFARPGGKLDVMVSTFDNATSLQGGALMTTSLYGIDNRVYALASGPVSIGGFSFAG
ncbi:MAG: flagellar basal body P-ring protein FlgI, partial [bacterium]|nr:flagellar basal body P-ring protein FlgI [bacterium]